MERADLSAAPLGVFDSGLGGLSVLRAIRARLPHEHLIYFADTACAPYGGRDADFIRARSERSAARLVELGVKALVVACNTATAVAVDALRTQLTIPVIGIEPAIKPAAAASRSKVVGVLATAATLASPRYTALALRVAGGARLLHQPCPGWVELVEAGDFASPTTFALVRERVAPLVAAGADTLVLGCTHYPFLEAAIRAAAGPGVSLIEPGAAVARVLHERLAAAGLLASGTALGATQFFSSRATPESAAIAARLWGAPLELRAW